MKICRRMEKQKTPISTVNAAVLRPAILLQLGNKKEAIALLRKAISNAEEHDMILHLAASRRRLGELLGDEKGDKFIQEANAIFAQEKIANPDKMIEVFAPGFKIRT